MKQPLSGISVTLMSVAVSIILASCFNFNNFTTWVAWAFMSMIPAQILIGVTWHGNPHFAENLRQPAKGVALLFTTLALGAIAASIAFFIVGDGVAPPAFTLISYAVLTLVVMLWFALMFGGWPFVRPAENSFKRGLLMLFTCYVISYALLYIFFDFSFLRGAPGYATGFFPHGLFNANSAIVFVVTFSSALSLFLHFNLWPLTIISPLRRQPWLGLAWTILSLAFGYAGMYFGVSILGLSPLSFLAWVAVPFVLGSIIVLNAMEDSLFSKMRQPLKGICNTLAAIALAYGLAAAYSTAAHQIVIRSSENSPPNSTYALWMATAMLVTLLPLLVLIDFFALWPFSRKARSLDLPTVPDNGIG